MSQHEHELTRKEMKAPDAFQAGAGKAAGWVSGHQKQIVMVVVGAVGLLAVGIGINSWLDARKVTSGGALYGVLEIADAQISSVPLPGASGPVFPNVEAQQRAVLAAAEALRRDYGSSEAARTAGLAAAAAHMRLGAFDAAIAEYETFISGSPSKDSLTFVAIEGLGYAKEAKGDTAGALAAFERLQSQVPARADRAVIERARILARNGKPDEARKLLQSFSKDFKDSQLRPEADKMLAGLGAGA